MSYASVAANNTLPLSQQPHPDPSLLNTTPPTAENLPSDNSKVNVTPRTMKIPPDTPINYADAGDSDNDDNDASPSRKRKRTKNKQLQEVEAEGSYIWAVAKHYLLQPGVAGGLIGLVNLGLLAGAGRAFYVRPHLRWDRSALSSTIFTAIALVSVEGYVAEKYRKTPRGQAEQSRAEKEGTFVYKHLYEQILRPGVLGGFVGLLNTTVLGTVGYFSYRNWDKPWNRRAVSAIVAGILAMWGGEWLLVERFRSRELNE